MQKSLAKNSLYNLIYKMLNVLFPLVSSAYLARVLSVGGIGKVAAAQNIAQYFLVIAALGMGSYGTRTIAKAVNREETNKAFSELFVINFVSTTISALVYYGFILTNDFFREERILYCTVGLNVVLNYCNVDWFYQGKEEYRYIMLRSIVVKVISLLFLLLTVKTSEDYILYALISCMAIAGNYFFNIFHLRKYVTFGLKNLHPARHLKRIFVLLASAIAIELYTMVDTTMLNVLQTEMEVGYYTNAVKIIRMVSNCIIAIGAVALPRLSYYYKNEQKSEFCVTCKAIVKVLLFISIPAAIGIFLLSENIVLILFGESFAGSVLTIRILAILIVVFAVAGGFSAQVLIARNNEKQYLISVLCGAAINIILNSFLIRKYMHNGAAVASVCAEITVLFVQLYFCKDTLKNIYTIKEAVSLLLSAALMTVVVLSICFVVKSDVLELLFSIVLGALSYFGCCLLLKNEQMIQLKGMLKGE